MERLWGRDEIAAGTKWEIGVAVETCFLECINPIMSLSIFRLETYKLRLDTKNDHLHLSPVRHL